MSVYLDYAATTPLYPEVVHQMSEVLLHAFGNPSSTHQAGRKAKTLLEQSRKKIAGLLGCQAKDLIFTSGATEANNWILTSAVHRLGIKRIITSRIEHPSVVECVASLAELSDVQTDYVSLTSSGHIDLSHLEQLLSDPKTTLVSLMYINNEVGTIADLGAIGTICRKYDALFHSDMVQAVGKWNINLAQIPVDFAVGSAHKFHGPKGVGFVYVKPGRTLGSLTHGGAQEKGYRAGTESLHNIAGMASALEIILARQESNTAHVREIKSYAVSRLTEHFSDMWINGGYEQTSPYILNIGLNWPESKTAMLAFQLDLKGIAISRGSACQSGSSAPSHVLAQMLTEDRQRQPNLRLSFSAFTQKSDIDALVAALLELAP